MNSRTDLDRAYMEKNGLGPAGRVKELLTYLCYTGFPNKTWRTLYMRKKKVWLGWEGYPPSRVTLLAGLPSQPGHPPSRVTLPAGLPAQPGYPPCRANFSPYLVSPSWVYSVKARQSSEHARVLSSAALGLSKEVNFFLM